MKAKYDTIGHNYNQTRTADPYLASRLLEHLNPRKSGVYLDIGCGTGNYTDVLQRIGYHFIGIDPSAKMLNQARFKNKHIDWRIGTAEQTRLEKHIVDGIIASLTIHHWNNLNLAFQELFRVLKPSGKIIIFTSTPNQMKGYWLNHYFPIMLQESIIQMPSYDSVERSMINAGFKIDRLEKYFVQSDLKDHFLYCGKHQAAYYLDPSIRNGISSFSAIANQDEVKSGLIAIKEDIHSGKINEIIQSYENGLGDYLYIIGSKH